MARSANLQWNHVSDVQLGKNDLADLRTALTPIAHNWESFVLQLGILHNTIQIIKLRNFYNPTNCLNDALAEWLDGNYDKERHGHQSWRKVCKETANAGGGNNRAEAEKIAAKHPVQQHGAGKRQIATSKQSQRIETEDGVGHAKPKRKTETDEGGDYDEIPKFPMKLIHVIQNKCEPLKPSKDHYKAVTDFAAKVKVVIQSCNNAEYFAALEAIECPPLPMFDKPVRYPNDENFTIVVGTFAGQNAAIVRTEQGNKCREDLNTILPWFQHAKMLLGVGVCMGIKHKLGDVLVGEKIQLEENPKVRRGKLQLVGPCNEAKQKVRRVFCGTTDWNNFECTDMPEGSDAKARISKAFSGCILSSPNLLDDPNIKHGLESETQSLIGAEMEGWVLFKYIEKDFPNIETLIIKGICDYGDGTKNKDWQLTAAKAAVDYTRFKLKNAFM